MFNRKTKKVFKSVSIITAVILFLFILWRFSPEPYLSWVITTCLILLIGCFTYYLRPEHEKRKWSIAKTLVITFFVFFLNYSVVPFIAPNISSFDIKNSYINSEYILLPTFTFELADNYKDSVKEQNFYLAQEAICKIKFPLFPLVNFVSIPIKEPINLLYNLANDDFKDYEINPLIRSLYIRNNRIFIEIKNITYFYIQETTINLSFGRKFTSKLHFPVSYSLIRENGDKFILDISLKNKYPFSIKNLFYIGENFARENTLGEFLDSTKYKKISIFKRDVSAGVAQIDKQGNLCVMGYFPIEPNEDMHFFMEIEKISNSEQTK